MVRGPGCEDLHRATDDERSERARSAPSVASRRVAAPYGVDDLALGRSIPSENRSNFRRATRADVTSAFVELATLAEAADDGHLRSCKFLHPGSATPIS